MKFKSYEYSSNCQKNEFLQISVAYSGISFTEFEKVEILNKLIDSVKESSFKDRQRFDIVEFDFCQGLKSVHDYLDEKESYGVMAVLRYRSAPYSDIEETAYYLENGKYVEKVNELDSFAAMGSGSEYVLGAYANFEGKFDDETLKKCFEIASRYDKNTSPTFDKLEFQGSK